MTEGAQTNHFDNLKDIILNNEDWLVERVLAYAVEHGYADYTSTLQEAWRLSISGLSRSIIEAAQSAKGILELSSGDDFQTDSVAAFGIVEAQRHRERGISFHMFLGLMKYYRQSYIDLIQIKVTDLKIQKYYELFIYRIFDRIEIGFCVEWSGAREDKITRELQINNRIVTNEKNKYLTIFESIPDPVIILNQAKKIDNMNLAAAKLFKDNLTPGSQYYSMNRGRQPKIEQHVDDNCKIDPSCFGEAKLPEILPWLESKIDTYLDNSLESMVFEEQIDNNDQTFFFRIKISKSLDISGKFDGMIIILEDITTLKQALLQVKTLSGLFPICSYCKKIRDDKGYWNQIESYIKEHSDAEFSHSICRECAQKYFPDLDIYHD